MSQFIPYDFANWAVRLLLAQGVIILFLLLNVVSFSMPHAGDFKPFFLLMAVYYWAIYRPSVMPAAYTFALGLTMDFLTGVPLGLSALILIGLQTIVQHSRLFLMGQPYIMVWVGFGIVAIGNALLLWLVTSLHSMNFPPVSVLAQALVAAFLSMLIFPIASLILHGVHRVLPVSSQPFRSMG